KIEICVAIIDALDKIHEEKAIHRDLHSGNVLFSKYSNTWYISDLGFCGPIQKPLGSIYGNLPYIDPQVIAGKDYTCASDIYSIGMLMWEISSGKPPFPEFDQDCYLAFMILNGMRPKTIIGTPLEYKNLMELCWDADPLKRPDINTIVKEITEIQKSYYQIETDEGKTIVSNEGI
ncbi:14473_t:CDS:1, partial [Funneliformis geosporum]